MDVKEEWNLQSISLQDLKLIEWICQTAFDSLILVQPMFNFNIV